MEKNGQICEDCGHQNPAENKFCGQCGNYLLDDYQQSTLPKEYIAAVEKLENRLQGRVNRHFWPAAASRPVFVASLAYLLLASAYIFLESDWAMFLGAWRVYGYVGLRLAEIAIVMGLSWKLKSPLHRRILWAACSLLLGWWLLNGWG